MSKTCCCWTKLRITEEVPVISKVEEDVRKLAWEYDSNSALLLLGYRKFCSQYCTFQKRRLLRGLKVQASGPCEHEVTRKKKTWPPGLGLRGLGLGQCQGTDQQLG